MFCTDVTSAAILVASLLKVYLLHSAHISHPRFHFLWTGTNRNDQQNGAMAPRSTHVNFETTHTRKYIYKKKTVSGFEFSRYERPKRRISNVRHRRDVSRAFRRRDARRDAKGDHPRLRSFGTIAPEAEDARSCESGPPLTALAD